MISGFWRMVTPAMMAAAAAMALWQVDRTVSVRAPATPPPISEEALRAQFPMPPLFVPPAEDAAPLLRAAVEAAPFSPARRYTPEPLAAASSGGAGPAAIASPVFVYKGQIAMGSITRAVLEDLKAGKTYFLQVGQEVAGFKVLDIDENRVVLSNASTHDSMTIARSPQAAP